MYGMPISPKAPTFGAGAKIGDADIAKKHIFRDAHKKDVSPGGCHAFLSLC